jgi:hypothetical protein
MSNDPNLAARITRQLQDDAIARNLRENVYGKPQSPIGNAVGNVGMLGAWSTIGLMLGMTIGAISAHERKVPAWEGGIEGAIGGFVLFFAIGFAVLAVFKSVGLGLTGIGKIFGAIRLGWVPRMVLRGAIIGAVAGFVLALLLDEPVDYALHAALRVAGFGAAGGFIFGLFRLFRKPAEKA